MASKMEKRSGVLTEEHVQELSLTFQHFDRNGDGRISMLEVAEVLQRLGETASQEELEAMMNCADIDGDGCIDLEEFISLHERAARTDTEERRTELKAVFALFDRDGNGKICAEELFHVMSGVEGAEVTLEDCLEMIRTADVNGDGQVDFSEFERLMCADCGFQGISVC